MKDIFKNKINNIKKKDDLLKSALVNVQKRRTLNRSRDLLPKKDRKEIKDKFYKIEHQRNISEEEQEEND